VAARLKARHETARTVRIQRYGALPSPAANPP
jgi:hypothetical protein